MTLEQLRELWKQVAGGLSPVEEAICRDVFEQGKGDRARMIGQFNILVRYCEAMAARLSA